MRKGALLILIAFVLCILYAVDVEANAYKVWGIGTKSVGKGGIEINYKNKMKNNDIILFQNNVDRRLIVCTRVTHSENSTV